MSRDPFLERLYLRNFRSFRQEVIEFSNPLLLVGRNGSGKSNFVDALAFLAECMSTPLLDVLSSRSFLWNSFESTRIHTPPFEIRGDFRYSEGVEIAGHYAFSVGFAIPNQLQVLREQCVIKDKNGASLSWFDRIQQSFSTNVPGLNPETEDYALALPVVGGMEKFAPVIRSMRSIRAYAINPASIRAPQEPTSDIYLRGDGSNLAGILERMIARDAHASERLLQLLAPVVPGIIGVVPIRVSQSQNSRLVLLFNQQGREEEATMLDASAMSDGTLTVLALIVAAMQNPAPSLIAIEEPELNIYPGALGAVSDLLEAAAERSQVVVTTHSPELLDKKWIQPGNIQIVQWNNGETKVSPLAEAAVSVLQRHLTGAGELLRANALDAASFFAQSAETNLFDELAV